MRLSDARPPMARVKDAKIDFESLLELLSDFQMDPMHVSWQDLDGEHSYGGAKGDEPKAFVYEVKVTFGNALKTPEAHHWVEALNTEIEQLLDTEMLRELSLPMFRQMHL